jgi:hypothetical protein
VERLVKRDRWKLIIAVGLVCLITGVFIALAIDYNRVEIRWDEVEVEVIEPPPDAVKA